MSGATSDRNAVLTLSFFSGLKYENQENAINLNHCYVCEYLYCYCKIILINILWVLDDVTRWGVSGEWIWSEIHHVIGPWRQYSVIPPKVLSVLSFYTRIPPFLNIVLRKSYMYVKCRYFKYLCKAETVFRDRRKFFGKFETLSGF